MEASWLFVKGKGERPGRAARCGMMAVVAAVLFAAVRSACWADAADASPAGIQLSLANPLAFDRQGEPVTCGVPLPRGFARTADQLALFDARGRAVPVQIQTTSRYADGTPRWVLLDFQADVSAGGKAVYRLAPGHRAATPARLSWRLEQGLAEIDTGVARFRIPTEGPGLLESVLVGARELIAPGRSGRAVLELAGTGTRRDDWETTRAVFEDAGPLSVTLALRCRLRGSGSVPLAESICRLRFYAGKSEVRAFYTLRNPAAHHHPGNIWDLGSGGSLFAEDFSIVLPLALEAARCRVGTEPDRPAVEATAIYQDSSGGPNWHSANHIDKDYKVRTSFRGYRVYRADEPVAEGLRADGWLEVRSATGGVAVAVREFWQNFPKTLAWRGGQLVIGLWPGRFAGVHEILGGEQKTHELLLLFHDGSLPAQAVRQRMEAFHRPMYAMPDPPAIYATRAFWPTGPLDRGRFKMLEQTCDSFVYPQGSPPASVMTKWEQIDEFGWRHFGDTFADNEMAPPEMARDFPEHHFGRQPISHFGNEYDVAYTVLLQGLRRGDPKWMWLGDVLCRHYADIGVYHSEAEPAAAYRHGPFTHTTHNTAAFRSTHRMYPVEATRYGLPYSSGGPNAGHCYVASLAQHYYLTGDRISREAFLEVAHWATHSPWFTQMMMGDKRGIGNLLMTHVYAYQLTGQRTYYDAAMKMIRYVKKPFEGLGATLFVKAAGRFLDMKIENGQLDGDYRLALEKMLMFGDLYLNLPDDRPRRWLEQTCFYAELLLTCYLHAPPDHPHRPRYFAKGMALMAKAQPRWPGTYRPTKTLTMCFANTGAFFKALAQRAKECNDAGLFPYPPAEDRGNGKKQNRLRYKIFCRPQAESVTAPRPIARPRNGPCRAAGGGWDARLHLGPKL